MNDVKPKVGKPNDMNIIKYILCVWFANKCPICGEQLFCRGGVAELEYCPDCGWREL